MKAYVQCPCVVSEGPRWNATERTLYWVDVTGGAYLRHRDGDVDTCYEVVRPEFGKIGALVLRPGGKLWLFTSGCRVWECEFGKTPEFKFALEGHGDRRFNDVWQDGGWCFCGVAAEHGRPGELWRMSANGEFTCIEPATAGMPNGMGVSPDGKTFYFIVSDERRIYAYDYDGLTGGLNNRRVMVDDFAEPGIPDGMGVDQGDGSLYVAIWNGSRLEHRSAGGRLMETFGFPMSKVTSVAVLDDRIFVTTGNKHEDPDSYFLETKAGSVFEIKKGERR